MIGSFNFSAFYGNDLIPTANFTPASPLYGDQGNDANYTISTSANFINFTTDKIPVRVDFPDISFGSFLYVDEKEINDSTNATTSIISETIVNIRQNRKMTLSFKHGSALASGDIAYADILLYNTLNNQVLASIYFELTNGI